jgi:hypothetical protein
LFCHLMMFYLNIIAVLNKFNSILTQKALFLQLETYPKSFNKNFGFDRFSDDLKTQDNKGSEF